MLKEIEIKDEAQVEKINRLACMRCGCLPKI